MRIQLNHPMSLHEIADAVSSSSSFNTIITHISTDTRTLCRGDLFIALKGERFDAEDFVLDASESGAYTLAESIDATIRVDSVNDAIPMLIRHYMKALPYLIYTVGITGSVGKTTTKELLRALIADKYRTHATSGNLNNLYGVMLTVLSAPQDVEALIIEVGMNHEGEIKIITDAIKPNVTVITNIGTAHIGNLGTREKIAKAKLEICNDKTEICIVPHDEALLSTATHRFSHSMANTTADAIFIPLRFDKDGTIFDLYSYGDAWLRKRFLISGRHIFECFCTAVTAAKYMRLTERELDTRLPHLTKEVLRQKFISIGKYKIYDDSYSASCEATVATLEMLLLRREPIYAVLFDMLELGENSEELHSLVGKRAAELGVRQLFLVGKFSEQYAIGALLGGMKRENIHINKDINDLSATLKVIKANVDDGILLVKGSHATRAERIIDMIRKEEAGC